MCSEVRPFSKGGVESWRVARSGQGRSWGLGLVPKAACSSEEHSISSRPNPGHWFMGHADYHQISHKDHPDSGTGQQPHRLTKGAQLFEYTCRLIVTNMDIVQQTSTKHRTITQWHFKCKHICCLRCSKYCRLRLSGTKWKAAHAMGNGWLTTQVQWEKWVCWAFLTTTKRESQLLSEFICIYGMCLEDNGWCSHWHSFS